MIDHCYECGGEGGECFCYPQAPQTSPPVKTVEGEGLRLGTYQSLWIMMGFDKRLDDVTNPMDSTVMCKMLDVYRSLCIGH